MISVRNRNITFGSKTRSVFTITLQEPFIIPGLIEFLFQHITLAHTVTLTSVRRFVPSVFSNRYCQRFWYLRRYPWQKVYRVQYTTTTLVPKHCYNNNRHSPCPGGHQKVLGLPPFWWSFAILAFPGSWGRRGPRHGFSFRPNSHGVGPDW